MPDVNLSKPENHVSTRAIGGHKHGLFLVTLVTLLLVSPLVDDDRSGGIVLSVLFSVALIVGAVVVSRIQRDRYVILALSAPWLYLTWLHPAWSGSTVDEIAGALLAACTFYMAVVLLRNVVTARVVTGDVICGAIAVYLLMGVAWAVIYVLLEGLSPGSFGLGDSSRGTVWDQLLYFSFATLTTLGYGDISPLSPLARIWAVFEAVCGTLFLAVLIARLVGVYKS